MSLTKQKFLTDSEQRTLLDRLERCTKLQDRVILEVAYETGARCSEILALTKQSLDHETQSIMFQGLKGSKDREIPLKPEVWQRLKEYASQCPTEQLFKIDRRQFYRVWTYYRPSRKALKALRHTRAIEVFKRHRDLRLVQVLLGHRNINNTMVYADYVYSTEELRKLLA